MWGPLFPTPQHTCHHLPPLGETLTEGGGSYKRVYLRDLREPAQAVPLASRVSVGSWVGTEPLSPSQQALGSGVPGGTLPTGSGQAASEVPCPGPGHAGEELLSPPERVFQVFFNRTHFLFMNESYTMKKKKKTFPRTKATFLTLSLFSFSNYYFICLTSGFPWLLNTHHHPLDLVVLPPL